MAIKVDSYNNLLVKFPEISSEWHPTLIRIHHSEKENLENSILKELKKLNIEVPFV